MKRFLFCLLWSVLASLQTPIALGGEQSTDAYLRKQSLQLHDGERTCSAQQVRGKSGRLYVITAAHCRDIAESKDGVISDSSGHSYKAKVVAEDGNSDLLILKGIPGRKPLPVAKGYNKTDHVRAFTRGQGYPPFKTEGELVVETIFDVPLFPILSGASAAACASAPKLRSLLTPDGAMFICSLHTKDVLTTVPIIPGSSGGMLVNDRGELVGIASAMDVRYPILSYFVRLYDIRHFLARF